MAVLEVEQYLGLTDLFIENVFLTGRLQPVLAKLCRIDADQI